MIVIETFARAAASAKPNRDDSFVIRNGLNQACDAATALPPTAHLMPNAVNCDPMLPFHHSARETGAPPANTATKLSHRHAAATAEPFPPLGQESNSSQTSAC